MEGNIEIAHPDSNRVGKFNLPYETLHDGAQRPMLQALFALCTVLQEEPHESGRGVRFIAAGDLFQPLAEGEEIPDYRIEFAYDMPFPAADHQARRLDVGRFGFVAIRQFVLRPPAVGIHAQAHLH